MQGSIFHIINGKLRKATDDAVRQHPRLIHQFKFTVGRIRSVTGVLAVVASVGLLIELTLYLGYEHNSQETAAILQLMRISQGIFILNILAGFFSGPGGAIRRASVVKWLVDLSVILSGVAWLYPNPAHPWLPWLSKLIYSDAFLFSVLATYSILDICQWTMSLIGRHTNPTLILSGSFIIIIIIGSLLLMLPRCTYSPISYADSLFISTSAVCITGLTPVDVPSTFTPGGLLVLAVLMQIGGLGVITFTSFFAIFFSGVPSIYSQLMIKDIIYSKSINSLVPTLLYILVFTLAIELAGAVAVYLTIPDALGFSTSDKLIFSGFHSLASFCNAGFSCLPGGMANPALLNSDQSIYAVTSVLIFAGAVGFPLLVNIKEIFVVWARRLLRLGKQSDSKRPLHIYDLNTKLVLATTVSILLIGSSGFFVLEYDNSLKGMTTYEKIIQSVFNALIPRSAGFESVSVAGLLPATLQLTVIQMWIGGASQSLAGGIKVNTFAAIMLNIRSTIRGHKSAHAFGRRISTGSIRRANAVLGLSAGAYLFYSVILLILEPELPAKSLLFESTSALFTVGSSFGITGDLSTASKLLLASAMFIGRVGILSLLSGFNGGKADRSYHYPVDNIIIS